MSQALPAPKDALPASAEAEQALLGALLMNNGAADQVREFLQAEHFSEPAHGRIYAVALDLIDEGKIASPITMRPRFEGDETLKLVGGAGYLIRLASAAVTLHHVEHYGRIIFETAVRRRLIAIAEDIDARARDPELKVEQAVDAAERELFDARHGGIQESRMMSGADALGEALAISGSGEQAAPPGVTTGIRALDAKIKKLRRGNYVILAARTGMGKSAFAASIARHAAGAGAGVGVISLEMRRHEFMVRLATDIAYRPNGGAISYTDVLDPEWQPSREQMDRLVRAQAELRGQSLLIDDRRSVPVTAIRASARRMIRGFERQGRRLDLLIVDHLGKVKDSGRVRDNMVARTGEVSGDLFALAGELDCCVLALAQLSRETEKRDDKRPTLADLRWSGDIEQDADAVIFLYREHYYVDREAWPSEPHEQQMRMAKLAELANKIEIIVAKQRSGPVGVVNAWCHMGANAFRDADPAEDMQGEML